VHHRLLHNWAYLQLALGQHRGRCGMLLLFVDGVGIEGEDDDDDIGIRIEMEILS
jgi:hypothetical protein